MSEEAGGGSVLDEFAELSLLGLPVVDEFAGTEDGRVSETPGTAVSAWFAGISGESDVDIALLARVAATVQHGCFVQGAIGRES